MTTGHLLAGRYLLREPIGRGGAGQVWSGDDQLLGRPVAVKQIFGGADAHASRERTLREARAAARIDHPGVVRVFDVIDDEAGLWLVMELVAPARPLDQVLREDGPLPPAAAAAVGIAVLDGLRASHAAGILHRDVKPGNILLGAEGRVVLTDFGIASRADDSALTQTGEIVGSPAYIAPERASASGQVTASSDLWSLGATLWTLVEGRAAFAREGGIPTLLAVLQDDPPPPVNAGPLAPLLRAMLEKDPAARPSVDEVRSQLTLIASGEATVTVPLPRRRAGRPALLGAGVVTAGVLAFAALQVAPGGGVDPAEAAPETSAPASSPAVLASPSSSTAGSPRAAAAVVRLQTPTASPTTSRATSPGAGASSGRKPEVGKPKAAMPSPASKPDGRETRKSEGGKGKSDKEKSTGNGKSAGEAKSASNGKSAGEGKSAGNGRSAGKAKSAGNGRSGGRGKSKS